MVEYVKNNKVAIVAVVVTIVLAIYITLFSKERIEEITTMNSHLETLVLSKDSTHSKDSLAYNTLQKYCDSLASVIKVYKSNEVEESSSKKGISETTVVTEKTNKDGSTEKTTTTTKVDTSSIVSKKVKQVLDSMQAVIEQIKKEVRVEIRYVHDTTHSVETVTKTVHDTTYQEKTVIITGEAKKLSLAGSVGVGSTGTLKVLPDLQVDARYTFWGPLFVRGGASFMGNPVTSISDPGNYRVGAGVGVRFDF